jgi:hypothetical protein
MKLPNGIFSAATHELPSDHEGGMTSTPSNEATHARRRNLWLDPNLKGKAKRRFREHWWGSFREEAENRKEMSKFDAFWERQPAISGLTGGYLALSPDALGHIYAELRIYSRYLNRVVQTNEALRTIAKAISDAHAATVRVSRGKEVQHSVETYSGRLFRLQQEFERFEKEYWDVVFTQGKLKFEGKEYPPLPTDPGWRTKRRLNPFLEERHTDLGLNRYRNVANPPYTDRLADDHGIRFTSDGIHLPVLQQERNLDTVFQVRIGDLLRWVTKRTSLTTVSRLVLLVYICAELVDDVEGRLTITGSEPPRELHVDKTYETLRDAGLR